MLRCKKIDNLAKDVPIAAMIIIKEKPDFDHAMTIIS